MKIYKSTINISGHSFPIVIEYAESITDAIQHFGGEKAPLDLLNDAYAMKQRLRERTNVVKRALNRVEFDTDTRKAMDYALQVVSEVVT